MSKTCNGTLMTSAGAAMTGCLVCGLRDNGIDGSAGGMVAKAVTNNPINSPAIVAQTLRKQLPKQ